MSEKRIPTLSREIDNEEKNENNEIKELPIDEEAVNKCVNKINSAKDLRQELKKMGVDIQQIAKIIVLVLEKESKWKKVNLEKKKAIDLNKKYKKRYEKKPDEEYNRIELLRIFTRAIARKIFVFENAKKIKRSSTKKRPYLTELIVLLKIYIFRPEKTKNPYRYIAALFNLFNLRPEKACNNCRYLDLPKEGCCEKSQIFSCPFHEDARHSLHQMFVSANTRLQDIFFLRIKTAQYSQILKTFR